jgi:drug/metabolite transporter (DMT)-like permease
MNPGLALILGSLAISLVPILYRAVEASISPVAAVFNRYWISMLILGIWELWGWLKVNPEEKLKRPQDTSGTKLPILGLLIGLSYLIFQVLWAQSLLDTNVATSTVLHNLSPIFTTLALWYFYNQRFSPNYLLGIGVTLVGLFLLAFKDINATTDKIYGDISAFISAVFYAIYLVLGERLKINLSTTLILLWASCITTIGSATVILINGSSLWPTSFHEWIIEIVLATVTYIIGHGFVVYSLQSFSSSLVSIVLLLCPILSSIEAWFIFSECLDAIEISSFLIMLFGIILVVISQSNSNSAQEV